MSSRLRQAVARCQAVAGGQRQAKKALVVPDVQVHLAAIVNDVHLRRPKTWRLRKIPSNTAHGKTQNESFSTTRLHPLAVHRKQTAEPAHPHPPWPWTGTLKSSSIVFLPSDATDKRLRARQCEGCFGLACSPTCLSLACGSNPCPMLHPRKRHRATPPPANVSHHALAPASKSLRTRGCRRRRVIVFFGGPCRGRDGV